MRNGNCSNCEQRIRHFAAFQRKSQFASSIYNMSFRNIGSDAITIKASIAKYTNNTCLKAQSQQPTPNSSLR